MDIALAQKAQAKMPINTRTHERKRPGKTNEVVKRKYISAEFERVRKPYRKRNATGVAISSGAGVSQGRRRRRPNNQSSGCGGLFSVGFSVQTSPQLQDDG
jgi:hypothetical protein